MLNCCLAEQGDVLCLRTFSEQLNMRVRFFLFVVICTALIPQAQAQNFTADPLTGRAMGNIPIWTVNSGDLAAGISLNYFSGVKVNDSEMNAGMNWSLTTGGILMREVRSLPDDYVASPNGIVTDIRYGWLHQNIARQVNSLVPVGDQNFSNCSDEVTDYNALSPLFSLDTEPDIFSFNAPGLSGKFLFDKNKVIQTIPYQDVKIDVSRGADSLINQVVITNNQGVKYTFTAGDKVVRLATQYLNHVPNYSPVIFNRLYNLYKSDYSPAKFYVSWYLSQITSPGGGNITFTYGGSYTTNSPEYVRRAMGANEIDTLFTIYSATTSQHLQTITGSNEKATITWNGNLVASVSINDLTYQSLIKKFNFQYHYVLGAAKFKSPKRAFLSGFNAELNCSAYPGYQFNYYGVNFAADTTSMPFGSSIKQDLFGYYDSTATSASPDIYISNGDVATNGERYRIAPATNYSLISTAGGRTVDPSKVYFGSMKTVTFPSGGITTFTYEAADYRDALTGTNILGGGARVKSIKTSGGDAASDISSTYKYRSYSNPAASSGQWTYAPMFVTFGYDNGQYGKVVRVPSNLAPEELILYYRTEVSTMGRGKTVYEFQNSAMYPTISSSDFIATLSRIALAGSATCPPVGNVRSGYYSAPYAPNTNYDIERGLPVRITDYARSGKIVRRKSFTYQRTTLPVTQVSGIALEATGTTYLYGKYTLLSNVNKVTLTESEKIYDQAYTDSTTQFVETVTTYTYNGNQMLSQAAVTNSDNSTRSQTFKYAKDYASTGTDTQSQMINSLVSSNRHGTLIESLALNGSTVTGASLTLFNNTYGQSRVLPSQQLTLGDPANFFASSVNGTNFSYASNNYYTTTYFDAFDALGHPTILRDQNRATKSVIYGYNNSLPALEISNARNDQVIYSDFEPLSGSLVTSTAPTVNTDSWSGQYSLALTSTTNVQQNGVARGIGKYYRFSCWAKASSSMTLSLSINGGTAISIPYPNASASAGTWQYLEMKVDMSAVAAGTNFNFLLTSSGNINLDNLAFYPEATTILAHAYDPLNGKTADLDSRGSAGFIDYDLLGRTRYLRNVDKDIIQINDYHYQSASGVTPVSTFTGNQSPNIGVSTTYTANTSCVPGVTYTWYVDGVAQAGTSASFNYTATISKDIRIKLVATASYGATSSTEMLVQPVPALTASLSLASGQSTSFSCADGTSVRNFTVTISGCYDPSSVTYTWYNNFGTDQVEIGTTTTNTLTYTLMNVPANHIYCVVSSNCTNQTTNYTQALQTQSNTIDFTGTACH